MLGKYNVLFNVKKTLCLKLDTGNKLNVIICFYAFLTNNKQCAIIQMIKGPNRLSKELIFKKS